MQKENNTTLFIIYDDKECWFAGQEHHMDDTFGGCNWENCFDKFIDEMNIREKGHNNKGVMVKFSYHMNDEEIKNFLNKFDKVIA